MIKEGEKNRSHINQNTIITIITFYLITSYYFHKPSRLMIRYEFFKLPKNTFQQEPIKHIPLKQKSPLSSLSISAIAQHEGA